MPRMQNYMDMRTRPAVILGAIDVLSPADAPRAVLRIAHLLIA